MNENDLIIEQGQIRVPCIELKQPIGTFYIASIDYEALCKITHVDVRRIEQEKRDIETYLGIQRGLSKKRVKEISGYVNTVDACFPTGIILAVNGKCAEYDEENRELILSSYAAEADTDEESIGFGKIANVLDGQHRIEGLRAFASNNANFDINVSIFVDLDIAEQAYIFSTVNLAQTKVNKSLVYDLYDLAKSPSPQKLCHNIAVTLDRTPNSPFSERIKRLGSATPGRYNETLTQATFVRALMPYLSRDENKDRDLYLRKKKLTRADAKDSEKMIFRNMMIENRDMDLTQVVFNYFSAVQERWPKAWASNGRGIMLNKTNGFKALMRFLRPAYLFLVGPGEIPSSDQFLEIFNKIDLTDDDFVIEEYKPGTSGEAKLYRTLLELSGIDKNGQEELF